MNAKVPDHYATLGLDRDCTEADIRLAYRALAKRHHPDVNPRLPQALAQIQALNAAYEELSDARRRQAYDQELTRAAQASVRHRGGVSVPRLTQEVALGLQEFFTGARLAVTVRDPAHAAAGETYPLLIPPDTAPGTRFRLPRTASANGGTLVVKVKARPDFRFKVRGSDLRCELKVSAQRATSGGQETLRGVTGQAVRVPVPPRVARGQVVRIAGEGLPKPRGGRGDLLVRITYRLEVKIARHPPG